MAARTGLYVSTKGDELRWRLRRAALDRRVTVQHLVGEILTTWLDEHAPDVDIDETQEGQMAAGSTTLAGRTTASR